MSMEGDTATVFRRCFAQVEAAIRRDPAHWRRWTNTDLIVGKKAWRNGVDGVPSRNVAVT